MSLEKAISDMRALRVGDCKDNALARLLAARTLCKVIELLTESADQNTKLKVSEILYEYRLFDHIRKAS